MFRIPPGTWSDLDLAGELRRLILDVLTECRANIKQKLKRSITSSYNIKYVALSLAPLGMTVTPPHWSRLAYLRQTYVDFMGVLNKSSAPPPPQDSTESQSEENEESTSTPPHPAAQASKNNNIWTSDMQFWSFVDTELNNTRQTYPNEGDLLEFFSGNLLDDLRKYTKIPKSLANEPKDIINDPNPVVFEWQVLIQNFMVW
ncbi:hypothetical protein FRC03_001602 [Tulasnella sp. 419]|nr:hypothetical protein FRC03_001602 [Tulasnella sp. 419]